MGFGRWWGHEGRALINEISVLIKGTSDRDPSSALPCEDTGWRYLSMSQEAGSYQTLNLPMHRPWTPHLQNYEKYMCVVKATQYMAVCYSSPHGLRYTWTITRNRLPPNRTPPTQPRDCCMKEMRRLYIWIFFIGYLNLYPVVSLHTYEITYG